MSASRFFTLLAGSALSALLVIATVSTLSTSAQEPPPWSQQDGSPGEEAPLEKVRPLTAEELERYTAVARELVRCINARDAETYRALHTEDAWSTAIPWWREMFPQQLELFGKIARAFTPRRETIAMGAMGYRGDHLDGATVLAHFEEPTGIALNFVLNDENKITHTSVFIHQQLGQVEPEGAKVIYELGGAAAE